MKNTNIKFSIWILVIIMLCCTINISAQKVPNNKPYSLGTTHEFLNQLFHQVAISKNSITLLKLNTSDTNKLEVKINYKKLEPANIMHLEGETTGNEAGSFILKIKDNLLEGNIILPKSKKAYIYYSDTDGKAFVKEADINSLICVDFFTPPGLAKKIKNSVLQTNNSNISDLQSYPGASGCLFLDFDGYNLPAGGGWNGGNALSAATSGMTSNEILEAWEIVAEDYRSFGLNVTTNESVFNTYPLNKRIRCVITSTNTVAPGYGGIAYVGDFSLLLDRPCWVFTSGVGTSGKFVGEATSHELGHTLGLAHDWTSTESYYSGQGQWAPIMGLSYYKSVTQWSKGEFTGAINKQDDLAIISGTTNGVGYRADDHGNLTTTATPLYIVGGQISTIATQNQGIIGDTGDIDAFSFNTSGGSIALNVAAASRHSDLRLKVDLYNDQNILINSYYASSTNLSLPIVINATLSSGKYYLLITGTSDGTGITGYTNYSSLGKYNISGTVLSNLPLLKSDSIQGNIQDISVFPNPVKNELNLNLGSVKDEYHVEVINTLGQTLYKTTTSEKILKISFSDKPSGIYFVTFKGTKNMIYKSFKIIKQ